MEKVVLLLRNGPVSPNYFTASSKVRDCFAFLHHGSRYYLIFDELNFVSVFLACVFALLEP